MDQERSTFGLLRDKQTECLMPLKVFTDFGVNQGSWFIVEGYEIESHTKVQRLCQGWINHCEDEKEEEIIYLPPKLKQVFKNDV